MRFLADENFPLPSVRLLRTSGLSVESVSEDRAGIDDEAVLRRALELGAVLLTFDRDFGDLPFRRHVSRLAGILYLRFEPATPLEPAEFLLGLLALGVELEGQFTVAERERLRQRPL